MATPDVRKLVIAAWVCAGVGGARACADPRPRGAPSLSLAGELEARAGLSTIVAKLNVTSTTYRYRLDAVLAGLGLSVLSQRLNVLVFFLIGKMPFGSRVTATLAQHFLMVPLILFHDGRPAPFFRRPGLDRRSWRSASQAGGPSQARALAVMGLRLVISGCGLVGACVYLANLNEVRALTASVHNPEDSLIESERTEDGCVSQDRETLKNIIGGGKEGTIAHADQERRPG